MMAKRAESCIPTILPKLLQDAHRAMTVPLLSGGNHWESTDTKVGKATELKIPISANTK